MMNLAMDNQVMLVAADAIRPIVDLLGSRSEAVQCLAAGTLMNLVFNAESKVAVIAAGTIPGGSGNCGCVLMPHIANEQSKQSI
jgi:hypothetical protein